MIRLVHGLKINERFRLNRNKNSYCSHLFLSYRENEYRCFSGIGFGTHK